MLRINKKGVKRREAGYVLSITLIILAITLLWLASFIKRQTYHEDLTRTLQQSASTKLVGQDYLESSKEEINRRFDKALKKWLVFYKEKYMPTCEEETKVIQALAAAQAYVGVSQSFFYGVPSGGSFSEPYLIKQEFAFRTPHLQQDLLTYVMGYNYVKDTTFLSSVSKKQFVTYETIVKKINNLKYSFTQDQATLESIQMEMENKLLYEVVAEVKVRNKNLEILDRVKMYLTLKLSQGGEEALPYGLRVDEYILDYK